MEMAYTQSIPLQIRSHQNTYIGHRAEYMFIKNDDDDAVAEHIQHNSGNNC